MRERSVVLLAIIAILGSMLAYTAARPGSVLAFGALDHFDVVVSGAPAAGTPFSVEVTARDDGGLAVEDYDGGATLSGDLGPSTSGCTGPCDAIYGTLTFVAAVATGSVTPFLAEIGVTVTAADGPITGSSAAFDVGPGPLASTVLSPATDSITADTHRSAYTAEGFDAYGNSRGDATDEVTFGIDPETGTETGCVAADCGSRTVGDYTVSDDTATGTASLAITPGAFDRFVFGSIETQTAGDEFMVNVTAEDAWGNTILTYAGSPSLTSDLGTAPRGDGRVQSIGTFVDGEATITVTAFKAETGRALTLEDGAVVSDSGAFTVLPADLDSFTIDLIGVTQTAGTAFTVTGRALDLYENPKTDYSGDGAVLSSTLLASPNSTGPTLGAIDWTTNPGIGTASVTATRAEPTANQTVTVSDGLVTATSNAFKVLPGPLASFTLAAIGATQVAGTGFGVTATAYDPFGNVKTNYTGTTAGLSSTLFASPFGNAPSVPANLAWGIGTGIGTASVTARKAELITSQFVTVTDGLVFKTSNGFLVNPAPVNQLDFSDPTVSFNGQPIDTKTGAPIYSVCAPPAVSLANPCANPPTSTPVKVLARDQFGNRVLPTLVSISKDGGGLLSSATTSNGEASFASALSIPVLGNFKLRAAAGAAPNALSVQRQIVNDLEACDNQLCDNLANNGSTNALVRTFDKITTGNDFFVAGNTNVILTTQFLAVGAINGKCGQTTIGTPTDVKVAGAGTVTTAPTSSMLIVIPKNTLKFYNVTSRGTPSFNVCLGALLLDPTHPAVPWKAKAASGSGLVNATQPSSEDVSEGRYWGVPANCGASDLRSTDPCIALRTKSAADVAAALGLPASQVATFMKDADLAILVRKPFPWDGKGGAH